MNQLKYDAMTLGNREFDNGPVFASSFIRTIPNTKVPNPLNYTYLIALDKYLTSSNAAKVVMSNLDWRAEPTFKPLTNVLPFAVLERGGHKYGILGVVLGTSVCAKHVRVCRRRGEVMLLKEFF